MRELVTVGDCIGFEEGSNYLKITVQDRGFRSCGADAAILGCGKIAAAVIERTKLWVSQYGYGT
jgi:hypothetical protein